MPTARHPIVAASIAALCVALAGCTTAGHAASDAMSTTFDKGVLAAEPDSGSAADRAAVRTAAAAALTNENRAFVVSTRLRGAPPDAVLTAVTRPSAVRSRAALLGRDRSPALASGLERSFLSSAHEEFGSTWSGSGSRAAFLDRDVWATSTFHVDDWQGVRVDGDTARVLVRGEDRGTDWAGTARRDAWAQYKLILRRDATAPNGWRLVRQQAASTAA